MNRTLTSSSRSDAPRRTAEMNTYEAILAARHEARCAPARMAALERRIARLERRR